MMFTRGARLLDFLEVHSGTFYRKYAMPRKFLVLTALILYQLCWCYVRYVIVGIKTMICPDLENESCSLVVA
jgi:hypothetical protein